MRWSMAHAGWGLLVANAPDAPPQARHLSPVAILACAVRLLVDGLLPAQQ